MKLFSYNRGERPLENKLFNEANGVHSSPYVYATQFVQNKKVLDCGCGGYGSDHLVKSET